jgi:hypothetical protein
MKPSNKKGQIESLAANEASDSGDDTMGGESEDVGHFNGKGTHNPGAPEFKAEARVVYIGQGGDEMRLGNAVEVLHHTVYLSSIRLIRCNTS